MKIAYRNYRGVADQQAMLELAQRTAPENLHVMDLPYRFSSWAFDHPDNIGLWHDEQGKLLAWAALQTPFWALDYYYLPDLPTLPQAILTWASAQAQRIVNTPSGRPIWFVNVFTEQRTHIADLEQAGWACLADIGADSWSKVFMARLSTATLATPALPARFTLRPLAAATEVEAYVKLHRAVFQSTSMTVAWRQRTLQHPAYKPELDLVIAAPDGQLAAFCIGWFDTQGLNGAPAGQIEPLGVDERYRGQGLGEAILVATVQRLHQLGPHKVYVETDSYRNAAFALYESVGFRVVKEVLVYRKEYHAETI